MVAFSGAKAKNTAFGRTHKPVTAKRFPDTLKSPTCAMAGGRWLAVSGFVRTPS